MTIWSVATVLKCLDEARDQDSKYRDQDQDQDIEAQDQDQDQDSKNAVSRLSRDETVSRGLIPITDVRLFFAKRLSLYMMHTSALNQRDLTTGWVQYILADFASI